MATRNHVELQGYVGNYIKMPTRRGDPARFDILTTDRVKTTDGQNLSLNNWHTIQCGDLELVKEQIHTNAEVAVEGRLVCRPNKHGKDVEIVGVSVRVVRTAAERGMT